MGDYGAQDRERQERDKRARDDKERQSWQKQGDDQIEVIKRSIDTVKVKVPQDVKGELDNLLQAVQSLVQHYKNQPTQLPADPNNPQAGQLPAQPGQPGYPSGQPVPGQPQPSNPMAPGGTPQPK